MGILGLLVKAGDCPPESGGQRDREAHPARVVPIGTILKVSALEPPRRFAPPLLTQEGIQSVEFTLSHYLDKRLLAFVNFFFDYDLDGWLDIFVADGRHVPNAAQLQPVDQVAAIRLNAFFLSMRGAALLVYLAPPANREGVRRNVFGDR